MLLLRVLWFTCYATDGECKFYIKSNFVFTHCVMSEAYNYDMLTLKWILSMSFKIQTWIIAMIWTFLYHELIIINYIMILLCNTKWHCCKTTVLPFLAEKNKEHHRKTNIIIIKSCENFFCSNGQQDHVLNITSSW